MISLNNNVHELGINYEIKLILYKCWLLYGYHNNMRVGDHKVLKMTLC